MSRSLAIVTSVLLLFSTSARADEVTFPDGRSWNYPGGLMIVRQGNQTTWLLGGVLVPRQVKVVTRTPEGKEYGRFRLPSLLHSPQVNPVPQSAPALLEVAVPDPHALVYVDGEQVRVRGKARSLESPPLPPGKSVTVRIRAAYASGDKFLIEDKEITLRAGETTSVAFDGRGALVVSLRKDAPQVGSR